MTYWEWIEEIKFRAFQVFVTMAAGAALGTFAYAVWRIFV